MTDAQFFWSWIVQFLIAAGTIGAVLAALYGNWFRAKFFPPKLSVRIANSDGDKTITRFDRGGEIEECDTRWYHLRVENDQRWSPATQVSVNIIKIELIDAAGLPFTSWTGEVPLKWRHQQIRQLNPTVGPGLDCDLFYVAKGRWLELQPMIAPFNMKHLHQGPCRMFVTVRASSVETDSDLLRIEIAWDGAWSEDREEMRAHLVFKPA